MDITGVITDTELSDFLSHRAVQKLHIVQLGKDRYEVIAVLTWKPGNWQVTTLKKKPREWVSLDRLVRSLLTKCPHGVPTIEMVLDSKFSDGPTDDDLSGH